MPHFLSISPIEFPTSTCLTGGQQEKSFCFEQRQKSVVKALLPKMADNDFLRRRLFFNFLSSAADVASRLTFLIRYFSLPFYRNFQGVVLKLNFQCPASNFASVSLFKSSSQKMIDFVERF